MSSKVTNLSALWKIHDFNHGPNPARVRIALIEKNLQSRVIFVPVDIGKGEHKVPEFLAKNYSGTIPLLELEDGTYLAECTGIIQYLDTIDGNPTLTGKTPLEQGLVHMYTRRAEIELLDAVGVYFHHATLGLGPHVEVYQNKEWGEKQREKAVRGMHYFDSVLQKTPFVAGSFFSEADINVIAGLIFANMVGIAVPVELYALSAWYAKVSERESVKGYSKL
jgi:glutathione S-transferase